MPAAPSSLHLDAEVINALLEQYVNAGGAARVSFREGRFLIEVGTMKLVVERLSVDTNGVDVDLGVNKAG
jgi:hypothetical protein